MIIKNISLSGFGKFKEKVNFNFRTGGIQVIVGKNGCGKSTLFNAITAVFTGLSTMEKERYLTGLSQGNLEIQNDNNTIRLFRNFQTDEVEIFNRVNGVEQSVYVGKNNHHSQPEPNYLKVLSKYIDNFNVDVFENISFVSRPRLTIPPETVFEKIRNHNSQSNLNFTIQNLQKIYNKNFGDNGNSDSEQNRLTTFEQQLLEKRKVVDKINNHMLKQKGVNEEILSLEDQLKETLKAEEIQSKQLNSMEKLCEYMHQESQIEESFNDLHQQKIVVDEIGTEIKKLQTTLDSQFPELSKFPGIQLKEDLHRWKELKIKRRDIENQLSQLTQERNQLENEIAKEVHLYQNVGSTFSMELTQYRRLTEEEQKIHAKLKQMILKINSEKKKLIHQQLLNLLLITAGTVVISIFQLHLNFSFNLMLIVSTLIFCFSIFCIDKWMWENKRAEIDECEYLKTKLEEDIKSHELKRQELGLRYYRFQNIEKTDQHIIGYANYKEKQRNLEELVTRSNILRAQLTTPAFQEMSTYYENLYGKQIDVEEPGLFEKIDQLVEYQQKNTALEHALTTHKKKEILIQKESDLKKRKDSMKEQIEGFLLENRQLRHLMENTQAINLELKYAEEQIERLNKKENQLTQEIQRKKIDLASISDFGGINLMHLQEDVQFLREKIRQLKFNKEVLETAIDGYFSVRKDYNKTFCENLNRLVNTQIQLLSNSDKIKISMKEDMQLMIWEDEKPVLPDQLSESMRMSLSLASRFAWIKHLSDVITLPVFLDDPFIGFDSEKKTGIENILKELSQTHQIVLFTIEENYKNWGHCDDFLP